ncbi:MAG: hypothetical protein AB7T59_19380 [Hyphomonadaceae bacterium]
MISLILYGRNDNHGYNLHKRAAISLNAMSEVLTERDDEILFVDYNTPDDLPTFPEAIADTLTDKTRERLRILRARPAIHAPFRSKTHLLALESISRNIALRRSNANNRWVLSTNTDMIFVPHKTAESLSEIVRDLPGGFYQLPRFELPEVLWESFDRRDGKGMIARTREWAHRFHLNEIVYGSPEILFDGPGDFQLCERADLIGIHGFHEGMLLGWHVDANLCARMIQLHGKIDSLADRLYAYHCDHTRQATAAHTHDRVENDSEEFNKSPGPQLPEQEANWGLPDAHIEEVRLGRADVFSRYLRALETAIPAAQNDIYESAYRADTYGGLTYRRAHVMPFVIDLLAPFSRKARVFYAGAREDTFADFVRAYKALGGAGVLTPAEFDWLNDGEAEKRPLAEALEQADVLVFEFGVGEPDQEVDRTAMFRRLASVRRAFIAAGAAEHARVAERACARRRVIGINAIHNEYESLIINYLAFNLTPFSSRVRHGYFLVESAAPQEQSFDVRSVWRDVQKQTGRRRALPLWETQELTKLATQAAGAGAATPLPSEALACAEYLIAFLRHEKVTQASGIEAGAARALADRLEKERPGAEVRARLERLGLLAETRALNALSRIADTSDWEKPSIARFVAHHFGGARAYGFPDRNPWTWERATVLDVLQEAGLLNLHSRVLVVGSHADALSPALADYVGRVEVARPGPPAGARFLGARSANEPDPEHYEAALPFWNPDAPDQPAFDAVIFVQNTIMAHGPEQVAAGINEAASLLRLGGLVLVVAEVAVNGTPRGFEVGIDPMLDGAFQRELARTGARLDFCGPFELGFTAANCDRLVDHARADLRHRRMLTVHGDGRVTAAGVITLRRVETATAPDLVSAEATVAQESSMPETMETISRIQSPVAHLDNAALAGVIATDLADLAHYRWREFYNHSRRHALSLAFRSRLARRFLSRMKFRPRMFALRPDLTWRGAPESWGQQLIAKPGVSVRDGVFEAPTGSPEEHAVYGPYLPIAAGNWTLRFKAEATGVEQGRVALAVDVTQSDAELAYRTYDAASLDGREQVIRFTAMTDFLYDITPNLQLVQVETRFAPLAGAGLRLWDVRMEPEQA